ncbi:MAG: hypothetical protein QM692_22845, partial [Thermomicrobiales bacterium]
GMHALLGLGAICGVAGLALLLGGLRAAICGAAVFATMPLTLWLLGHALIDFFTVLCTLASLAGLLLWQRTGSARWALLAGALAGLGLTAKLNMLPMIAVLGGALLLVGRAGDGWRMRLLAGVAFGGGTLVALPWVLRSVLANGALSPKIQVALNALAVRLGMTGPLGGVLPLPAPSATPGLAVYDAQVGTLGTSPLALLQIPWFFTFHADEHRFLVVGRGEIGVVLLLLLPFLLLLPRSRGVALVGVAALLSYLAWVFTPYQIIRHLLPTFALATVLVGVAAGRVLETRGDHWQAMLRGALRSGVVAGVAVSPVFLLLGVLTQVPVNYLTGRESAAAYVERVVPAAVALEAASALPPDTPVVYFGRMDGGAQIYTEARLLYVEPNASLSSLGETPAEVLASLDALGVRYVIWNRPATTTDDWQATVLSLAFLREHTRVLAGDQNAYLFELLPDGGHEWAAGPNLLADPELDTVKRGDGPWTATGEIKGSRGSRYIPNGGMLAQRVPVTGGAAYLLVADASCEHLASNLELALRWYDVNQQELGRTLERVNPGVDGGGEFLWHRAPAAATSVAVELAPSFQSGRCELTAVSLTAQP